MRAKLSFHKSWEDFKEELDFHQHTMSRQDLDVKGKNEVILTKLMELQKQYKVQTALNLFSLAIVSDF